MSEDDNDEVEWWSDGVVVAWVRLGWLRRELCWDERGCCRVAD